jgi:hypothetical protein
MSLPIFLLVFACSVVAALFWDVIWGLWFYTLLYFVNPPIRWWYTIGDLRFQFIIALVFIISYIIRFGRYYIPFGILPQTKWLALFYGGMLILSFYAIWPERHDAMLIQMGKNYVFLIIAFIAVDTFKKLEGLIWAFLAGCTYISYYATFTAFRDEWGRIEGVGVMDGSAANTTAAVLIVAVPFFISYILTGRIWQRVVSGMCLVLNLNALILINSRGAFVGLACSFFYYLLSLFRFKIYARLNKAYIVCILLAVLCGGLYLTDDVFWSRMDTLKDVEVGEGGATRILFWLKSIDVAKAYPFGTGVSGFEFLSPQILLPEYLSPETGTRVIHSTYFQALSDFGFMGPVIVLGLIISNFLSLRKVQIYLFKQDQIQKLMLTLALEAGYLAYLVSIAFIDRLYSEVFFWFALYCGLLYKFYRLETWE